jgi:hypothetical protein
MSEKKVKERLITRFCDSLEEIDVTDNYAATARKLESNGIALVRTAPQRPNMFAYTYSLLLVFLCLLAGFVGFNIGVKNDNPELISPSMKKYLEANCENYYHQPILAGHYSKNDYIYVCIGLVREGNELGVNYFYHLVYFDVNLDTGFKNLTTGEEITVSRMPVFGNLSDLLNIDDGDEILIEIRGDEEIKQYSFIAYHDIHMELIKNKKS